MNGMPTPPTLSWSFVYLPTLVKLYSSVASSAMSSKEFVMVVESIREPLLGRRPAMDRLV